MGVGLWPEDVGELVPAAVFDENGVQKGPTADVQYQRDPIGWFERVLGVPRAQVVWSLNAEYARHQWDGTPDPLARICEAIANGQDTAVESATGTGKTFLAAGLALWFFACFDDALVITTAPKEGQLTTQLWKEIGRHWPRFKAHYPTASKVMLRVRMKEGAGEQETWAILGYACGVGSTEESATKAQGFHASHMLIITEETPGVDPAVMTAFKNTCTGDHNVRLALGNPDHPKDALHQMCGERGVTAVRISALDHPNVVCGREIISGAAGRRSVANMLDQYKSERHPMYKSRVRGICPSEGTVPFPREAVERCDAPLSDNMPAAWGWDLARSMDETVGIPLDVGGNVTKAFQRWAQMPWPKQVRAIVELMAKVPGAMDSTGVGDPVLQFASELGAQVAPYVFTDRSRHELLQRLQGAILDQTIRGPFKEGGELHWITEQLAAFEFVFTPSGVRWKAPEGQHDDGVFGLALAVYAYDRIQPTLAALPVPRQDMGHDPHRWQEYAGVGEGQRDDFNGLGGGW